MLPERIGGRYRVLRELGRGGMGVVVLAEEAGRTEPVALKVLLSRDYSEAALRHFEQEFRTLTELSHPNLTEVYDFGRVTLPGRQGAVPFFTMRFVEGETIAPYLARRAGGERLLLHCAVQVTQALAYLHGRGLVHQDVKPSNVMVSEPGDGSGTPQVTLMDLGLAGRPVLPGTPGSVRGTVAYLSPEAARGQAPDARSDLYALGCTLYELITGRPPFVGPSALTVLRGHVQEEPLPPSVLQPAVTPAVEGLILRLLAKDPGLRPPSADALLGMLDVAAGGGLGVATPQTRRQRVLGCGFVGRQRELDVLAAALAEARAGAPSVVLVSGEAGIGRTRLLREFQVRAQLDGVDVAGAAADEAGDANPLAEALVRLVRARGPLGSDLLARHGAALEPLLGPLARPEGGPPAVHPLGEGERFRRAAAIAALLEEVGRAGPVVLALDDLHAAGETTGVLLLQLARVLRESGSAPHRALPVLVVGTLRPDEAGPGSRMGPALARMREEGTAREIVLDRLGRPEVAAMLRAMLGVPEIPDRFLDRVLEETRGTPLFTVELVALLAEEGHVAPGDAASLRPEALDDARLPRALRDVLARRLARAPSAALPVLQAAAVLGGAALTPDGIAGITDLRWEHVLRMLLLLAEQGLAVAATDESGDPVYRLAHPALRALVAEQTPPDSSRRLHARALTALERQGVPRGAGAFATMARHAEGGGQPGRAAEAWARSADLARELHAHHDAIESYGRAIGLAVTQPSSATPMICSLYERRGDAHEHVGDAARAEEDYRWMLASAQKGGHDLLKARAHLRLGRVLAARSDHAGAQESLEIALELAERTQDPAVAAQAEIAIGRLAVGLGRFDAAAESYARARERAAAAGAVALEVEALLASGALQRELGNSRASLALLDEAAARTAGGAPPALEIAVREGSALALEVQGRHREAAEAFGVARQRAREIGDVRSEAALTIHVAAALARLGELETARTEYEHALVLERRLGAPEGVVAALLGVASLQLDRGRAEEALATAADALHQARSAGREDLAAAALALAGRVHARMGDHDGAAERLEEAQRVMRGLRSPRQLAALLVDLGELRLQQGQAASARAHHQEAAFLARKAGDRRLESAAMSRLGEAHLQDNDFDRAQVACRKALGLVEGWGLPREEADARLLRARIELGRPGGDIVRAELDAIEAARQYRQLAEPDALWQAEHAAGRASLRLGRTEEALGRLDRAHRWLEGVRGRLPERWRDRFLADPRRRELYDDWARLKADTAAPAATAEEAGAAEEVVRLRRRLRALEALLDLTRVLAATPDGARRREAVLDTAIAVTGAARGVLVEEGSDGTEAIAHRAREGVAALAGEALAWSRAVADSVLASGQPLLVADALTDDRLRALPPPPEPRPRSVLCVPVPIAEDHGAAIYLEAAPGEATLSTPQLEVATRLAEQTALALRTVRLLERVEEQRSALERLNLELQRTVAAQQTEIASVREELLSTRSSIELRFGYGGLVGGAPSMQRLYHLIERVAPTRLPVLVTGESGTGKELVARAVHAGSDRSAGPFFAINCAALSESLLESELFGYRKGAFTGADRDKPGYFELADGGTLFLDEIGELGLGMQAKLLRALEQGEVLPIGGKSARKVDVRVVSATNQDLQASMREGRFREDLYYRLDVARIHVPPLRERREDIPLLVDHFLGSLAEGAETQRELEPDALRRLAAHDWPGNVRELQHVVMRVAALARRQVIALRDVERYADLPARSTAAVEAAPPAPEDVDSLETLERRQILLALERAGGNKSKAADLLGINRATLFRKLKRLQV